MLGNKSWFEIVRWNLNVMVLLTMLTFSWYTAIQYDSNFRVVRVNSKIQRMHKEDVVIMHTMSHGVVKPRVILWLDISYLGRWYRNQVKDFISDTPVNFTMGDDYSVDILVYKDAYYRIATAEDPKDSKYGFTVVALCFFAMLMLGESALIDYLKWGEQEKIQ